MIRTPSIARPRNHLRSRSGGLTGRRRRGGLDDESGLDRYVLVLRISWCLVVLYGEVWKFHRQVESCEWPNNGFGYELTRSGSKPFKLLLVADPIRSIHHAIKQILDLRSYPGRNILLRYLGIWITDNYARKAWRMVLKSHKPDAVFFMGDLLDSGVEVTDRDEHSHYVHRFQNIFPPIPRSLPMHYIPGNHDLGLHLTPGGSAYARERFTETFGPLNGHLQMGNHTIVWIDATGLLEERSLAAKKFDTQSFDATNGGVVEFLRGFAAAPPKLPRILLSHIPLYRTEGTPCGPLRESRHNLHQGRGKNYQNEIDHSASSFLLAATDPTLIFSGNDHDYCSVTHHLAMSSPNEITCKSFSMALGVKQPGYQLVTLLNPYHRDPVTMMSSKTHQERLCSLPDQIAIYTRLYIPCILLSILILALPKVYYNLRSRRGTTARSNGLPMHSSSLSRSLLGRRSSVKPADEEDDDDSAIVSDADDDDGDDSIIIHPDSYSSGYPISPSHANYSYHSPTDDDYVNIATPREIVPRQGKSRVRRVSRVWLWNPKTSDDDYLSFLKRLGPIYRYFIRPIERTLRRVFHRLYVRRLQLLVAKLNSGNVLGETAQDMVQIGWVALLLYAGIWAWYTW